MLLIERHYIRRWGGSFTENFYGIKRERVIAKELPRASKAAPDLLASSTKLRRLDVWKSLFIIVGFLFCFFAGGGCLNELRGGMVLIGFWGVDRLGFRI